MVLDSFTEFPYLLTMQSGDLSHDTLSLGPLGTAKRESGLLVLILFLVVHRFTIEFRPALVVQAESGPSVALAAHLHL